MKKTILFALALAVFASCSQNESETTVNDGQIRVNVGFEASKSKAVATAALGLTGVQFMRLDALTTPTDFSSVTTPIVGNIASGAGAVIFTPTTPAYNMNGQNAYMIAYHPIGTLATGVVTWAVNGQTDIVSTNVVWDAGDYVTPISTGMILNHQLSQVEVICKAEGAPADIATVRSAWGKIKKIEFLGAPTTTTYTLNGLAIANGTVKVDFPLLADYNGTAFAAIDVPTSTNTVSNAVAMLAPIAVSVNSFQIKVSTEGATAVPGDDIAKTLNISLNSTNAAMERGKTHKVTLTFKANAKGIVITSSVIAPWTVGSSGSSDVDKDPAI